MKYLFIITFIFLSLNGYSQKKCDCTFRGITSFGIHLGQRGTMPFGQFSGGVVKKNYFLGIGTGFDAYTFNSVPVFVDGRKNFGLKNNWFLYLNAGYNLNVDKGRGKLRLSDEIDRTRGGIFLDAGSGFRLKLSKGHALLFSAGWSHKKMSFTTIEDGPCISGSCSETFSRYKYSFSRILGRLSWEIGR